MWLGMRAGLLHAGDVARRESRRRFALAAVTRDARYSDCIAPNNTLLTDAFSLLRRAHRAAKRER